MALQDHIIVGGGIIGLATAWTILRRHPGASVVLLEKEAAVAAHQSSHNSGVAHAGVYYAPGSLKSRLCREGIDATLAFCSEHGVAHRRCGKLIVATNERERTRLAELHKRAIANDLDCHQIDAAELRDAEPEISGVAALRINNTGIVDYPGLCRALTGLISDEGGTIMLQQEVVGLNERSDCVEVITAAERYHARRVIVCAGLHSDRLARMAGLDVDFAIVPFRGDYFRLPSARNGMIDSLIYPVSDPTLPFLGIHLTLTVDGSITLGPSAMLAFKREGYTRFAFDARDTLAMARFAGTWRLLGRYPRAGIGEMTRALSRRLYLHAARRYCPGLTLDDLVGDHCGVRAQAVAADGQLIHDFLIKRTARSVHVCNAPSPAATSAFPIAAHIVDAAIEQL